MPTRYKVTETCVYTVEADSEEEALEIFLARSPGLPKAPVEFWEVSEREFVREEAT